MANENNKPAEKPIDAKQGLKYEIVKDASTGADRIVTGHITRDSIIEFQNAKLIEAGKSPAEALDLAVKRGYEMVRA